MSAAPGGPSGEAGPRWGMVVDLNRCVGCQTCTIACKHANDTPPGVQWRRVLDVEQGTFPDVERLFLVVGCQHCAEPPCVPVCPTGATGQRADGLVTMDYDTCIGCGYCAVACPYQARTITHDREWFYGESTVQEERVHHGERVGVATKCTFCVERVDEALEEGMTPGVDLDYTPACSSACIAQAIHFGDFNDPGSNVSRLAAENESFRMHERLGTDPQIRYLYSVPGATPGRRAGLAGESEPEGSTSPLAGERQAFWDARAAMNFILGGMSSGMVVALAVACLLGAVPAGEVALLNLAAAAGMAAGLLSVLLEIGRKRRFWRVLMRPRSSWMTRETYAVAAFYPAVAAGLLWPDPLVHAVAGLAAAAFLYCQARIPHAAKGVAAWCMGVTPAMLVATGLLEGVGLLAASAAALGVPAPGAGPLRPLLALSGCLLALCCCLLWRLYTGRAEASGVPPASRAELRRITPFMYAAGYGAPLALLMAWMWGAGWWAPALGGLSAVAGGALMKFTLIVRACHQRGFELPFAPQRGSGSLAAPPRSGALARRAAR